MKESPRVGATAEKKFTVEPVHAIAFGDGGPAVLSTPWLIWFLEHAALEAALPFLDAGEITVGTHVDIEHLAPTPVGKQVVCRARIVHSEGRMISFQVEASDERETIARGLHKRCALNAGKFAARVQQKTSSVPK